MSDVGHNSIPGDEIRQFVERIVRLKEEQAGIASDVRDIYAEAKGRGFDKTALGQLVTYVMKRATNADAVAEREAMFDLYLEAYTNAADPRTRMRVPAREEAVSGQMDARTLATIIEGSRTKVGRKVLRSAIAAVSTPFLDPETGEIIKDTPEEADETTRIETAEHSDGSHDVESDPVETSVSIEEPLSNGSGGMQAEYDVPSPQLITVPAAASAGAGATGTDSGDRAEPATDAVPVATQYERFERKPLTPGGPLQRQIMSDYGCTAEQADEVHAWQHKDRPVALVRKLAGLD